ncbi:MAG: hypothetical protein R3D62_01485 [Xanthobacteraceae bacterium]
MTILARRRVGEVSVFSSKPTVERHVQTEIHAIVGSAPFSDQARDAYRPYAIKL